MKPLLFAFLGHREGLKERKKKPFHTRCTAKFNFTQFSIIFPHDEVVRKS